MELNNKKLFWRLGLVFLAVFFVFIFVSDNANASDQDAKDIIEMFVPGGALINRLGDPLSRVFVGLLYGVFEVMVWFLGIAGSIFSWVIDPNNVSFITKNPGLYASWAMVRDFLNLGFILVLLYIAFCVIFQIGSYSDGWKKMLLMMIIMALLVNFSFPICRIIIDISNIAFYYIINMGLGELKSGDAMVAKFSDQAGLGVILAKASKSVSISYLIAMIIFTFVTAITFFVIACLFVVRMVAIGILIIFSPIGFAGAAFPFSQKYASDWWDNLFKYAFFAPIMMFMMLIASNIMSFTKPESMIIATKANLGPDQDPNFLGTAAYFSIPIVILWFGMGMAQKMSIAGASAVTGGAQKFGKWAGKNLTGQAGLGGWAAHWANRSLANTKYGKFVSPMALKAAYQARMKRMDEEALAKSTGGVENIMNRVVDWASTANPYFLAKRLKRGLGDKKAGLSFKEGFMSDFDKVDYDFIKRQQAARKEEKEIAEVSENSDYVIRRAKQALDNGNFEEFHGAIMNLAKNNNINDLMYGALGRKYGSNGVMDPILAKNVLKQMYKDAGADEKAAARNLSIISGIGEGKGNMALSGWATLDGDEFRITSDDEQGKIALAKWGEMEPQDRQKKLHKDGLFTTIYADGKVKVAGIGKIQKKIFEEGISGGDLAQVERIRTDTGQMIDRFEREGAQGISEEIKKNIKEKFEFDIDTTVDIKKDIGSAFIKEAARFNREGKKK